MKISFVTLFPEMFASVFDYSILKRAQEKKIVQLEYVHMRNFGISPHNLVDDTPYGGGVGMVLRVDVVSKAISHSRCKKSCSERVILVDAQGKPFAQKKAYELSSYNHLIFVCGRYEGFDERIKKFVDEEISIGDYILTGGELPAMVITDAVTRLLPGVLGKDESSISESFQEISIQKDTQTAHSVQLLEYPQYTRPEEFKGLKVPKVLLSGDHTKIAQWRKEQAIIKTKNVRPDLLRKIYQGEAEDVLC